MSAESPLSTAEVGEEKKEKEQEKEIDDREFSLFGNQVAGHFPILYYNGSLYKPAPDLEILFYQNILRWLPSIKTFIPKYIGIENIKNININELSSNNNKIMTYNKSNNDDDDDDDDIDDINYSKHCFNKNKHRIKNMKFLILEDITNLYYKPCILDIKIGIRHFSPICNNIKKKRKLKKSWCSTNRYLGIRIGGMQIYDNKNKKYQFIDKYSAMQYKINEFIEKIQKYFTKSHHYKKIIKYFINKIKKLINILKNENRFRWFSCSLLFVYEGYESSFNSSNNFDPNRLDLRLIDFSNFVVIENYVDQMNKNQNKKQNQNNNNNYNDNDEILQLTQELDNLSEPDYGLLFGLESMLKLLIELNKTNKIKLRNNNEWIKFRDSIIYSQKALLPFNEYNDFDENTTIKKKNIIIK